MYLLFAGYTVTRHTVPGVGKLGDDIVSCEVADTSETEADGEIGAVALEEITRGLEHWGMRDCLSVIILFSWRRRAGNGIWGEVSLSTLQELESGACGDWTRTALFSLSNTLFFFPVVARYAHLSGVCLSVVLYSISIVCT